MLQIGARIIHCFGVILTGYYNYSRVLMNKHHQSEMIRRREVIEGWWGGIKKRQESDTGQWRGVKGRQERVKGQWDALKVGEDTLKGDPVALKQRGYMLL